MTLRHAIGWAWICCFLLVQTACEFSAGRAMIGWLTLATTGYLVAGLALGWLLAEVRRTEEGRR